MSKRMQLWLFCRAWVCRDWNALHELAAYYASAHEDGLLPRKYYNRACSYYKYGAKKGNQACQYDYGFMLILGNVGKEDKKGGLLWIRKAAEGGYLAAKDFLADYPQ